MKVRSLSLAVTAALFACGCSSSLKTVYKVDEDAVDEPTVVEQQPVAVAGSRIKRKRRAGDRAMPVRVISREDIEQSGAATAGEVLGQSGNLPF